MKKNYMTPMVMFSNSASATTFASKCGTKFNQTELTCTIDGGEDPFAEVEGTHMFFFAYGQNQLCNTQPGDGQLCYQAPTANEVIFTS